MYQNTKQSKIVEILGRTSKVLFQTEALKKPTRRQNRTSKKSPMELCFSYIPIRCRILFKFQRCQKNDFL
ncbi:hypothetical protein LEP1GSC068_1230 [Leptospira sp. Fiocruz LV3954]|uniref:Uncharacterized protein n=1 Tax=Leptospira santarosai TaxID=28183 RepID=A0AB73LKH7_9LEPT|nr:hypothetical protein B2G51_04595 [Leptospira santarosai]EKO76599.1 hypothetical protein LEP1GSC068_1230 [Leptospira sp. Fiocruz LV3954]EMI60519.1 hypothetical protein LEP1GSC076_0666 [Leptospira sp. Fiocruz LV4135]OLY61360.1 hypothetical protein BV917_05750 [Leptospira santarosai serovar Guaricura]ONF87923.1 hypothetical protein BWD13_05915 [Leptospira santarosai serovar Grippotyphosa]